MSWPAGSLASSMVGELLAAGGRQVTGDVELDRRGGEAAGVALLGEVIVRLASDS